MTSKDGTSRFGWLREAGIKLGLVVLGVALPLLAVEVWLRASGRADPAQLDATFDRPIDYYRSEGSRMSPWAAGHPDPLRIAVIGDSFTDGQWNHGYDAYPARLEALLNLNAGMRPVEVRTYAERGSSTHGQLRYLRRAVAWKPEIIILGIFINDTERMYDHALRVERDAIRPRIPTGRLAWTLRRCAVMAWLYQRLENLRSSRATLRYYRRIYDPESKGFQLFQRAIHFFGSTTRARGIDFLPVIFPGMAAMGTDYDLRFAHDSIHAVLEAENLEYLDLLDAYARTAPVRMSAFPVVDPHPSEIAHRIAADAIFHRLLDDGSIEPGYRPTRVEQKSRKDWLREARQMHSVVHLAPE